MAPNTHMIAVTVNGETRRVPENTAIAHLVRMLELDPLKVAVECNRHVVPRSTLETVTLSEGDVLEIVHFVGGG
ncbi:sulfur carrier protein ThiS [Croceicoccus mobilis]|uniref:Thiamine biosynthesis protein ThiS n=1 Tax=Croceicoccus mobilis TaxID=1703339 RepID=A0A916YT40_9SPHN|nr:thiamine biosynthesis protein ThiS [Croceicoccus mobilis]